MDAKVKAIWGLSAAAAMFAGAVGPAAAQTMRTEGPPPNDPVVLWADQMMPRHEFALNSDQEIELIRYKTPRDIDICIARPDPDSVVSTRKAVPVTVKWDGNVGEIWPGNCLSFDAKSVKIRPAAPLPGDGQLIGTFRVIH